MHSARRSKPEIDCLWQLSSDTGSTPRLNAATLCLRCPRKLSRELLISLHMRLAFCVHRIHNE